MKKIKFLLLHLGYGGIETATINTTQALCEDYQIELVSFYNLKENQASLVNPKIKLTYLYDGSPNKAEFMHCLKKLKIFSAFKEGIKAAKILFLKKYLIIKEIRKDNFDAIVSTRNEFSILLSKYGSKNKIKIVQEHHHHNNNSKYINTIKYKYKNIDYLCALTKSLKKDYEKFLLNNKHTKVVLLPNMLVNNINVKSSLKFNNVISVSRLDKGKKIDELIEIFSKIDNKENKLYIIGDGPELNNLKDLAINLGIEERVIFTGYLDHSQQKEYFLSSRVFAMTSISEGLPMVLLEAMQYGLPCIAYKTESGVSDIIFNNKNGFVIYNRNEKEYINKLNYLLENLNVAKDFSKEAIKTTSLFSSNNVKKIWNEILN